MYKALVVEDEQQIRNGLLGLPIWEELGFEQVLAADDGITAMETVRQTDDIRLVVTDIKMKKMSGMELIRQLYDERAFTGKVIIMSGYDDFQYARQALSYGVVDFLLKPVNIAELKQVIMKALLLLEREDKRETSLNIVEDAMSKLRERLLQEMMERSSQAIAAESIRHQLQQYELGWLGSDKLVMMTIEADNLKAYAQQGHSSRELGRIRFAIGNVLEHSLLEQVEYAGNYVIFRSMPDNHWLVVFGVCQERSAAFRQWIGDFKVLLAARMKKYVKASTTIVATSEGSLETLPNLYDEALGKLTQSKIYGDRSSDSELELEALHTFRDVDLLMEPKALVDLLKHGGEQEVRETMLLFPIMVREWGISLIRDLHHRVFEWLLDIFAESRKAGWKREEWKKNPILIWERIEALDTSEALQSLILDYLLQVNAELQGNPGNQILHKAEQYIREHYAEPITVQTVADHVYLSPEWLSTLFKKNVGMTFLDYVTDVRMEKAKELLQDLALKVYQISNEVGYRDTVYFSKLFKKKFGYTPKEYRNLKGIYEDD